MEINPYNYKSFIYQELRKSVPYNYLDDYAQDVLLDLLVNADKYNPERGGDAEDPYMFFVVMRIRAVLSTNAEKYNTHKRKASVSSLEGLTEGSDTSTFRPEELDLKSLYEPTSDLPVQEIIQEMRREGLIPNELELRLQGITYDLQAKDEGVTNAAIQRRIYKLHKSNADKLQRIKEMYFEH